MEFEELLTEYNNGNISINEFKRRITHSYIVNVGKNIAKLDINRNYRKGIPEVIYAANKNYSDIEKIILNILEKNNTIVVSKIQKEHSNKLLNFVKKKNYILKVEEAALLFSYQKFQNSITNILK